MVHILLWVMIVTQAVSALGNIVLIGQKRTETTYTIANAIGAVIGASIMIPLFLNILGRI